MTIKITRSVLVLCVVMIPSAANSFESETRRVAPLAVSQFYAERNDAPAWSNNRQFDDLIQAIEGLTDHGLEPEEYHLAALRLLRDMPEKREKLATGAWLAAAAHLVYGKLSPLTYEPHWTVPLRRRNLLTDLNVALSGESIKDSLAALAPSYPEYIALTTELSRLRQQQEAPIHVVSDGSLLKPGIAGARVDALQARLIQLGLMSKNANTGVYDKTTEEAVKVFQETNGLDADGIVGQATRETLNRGVQSKINQLRVNLERWRWLPDDLGRRHVRVNIADFSVAAYNGRVLERSHLAIIGQRYRKTPVFSDRIKFVVLNPWWETPDSLAKKDKLPLFKQDPAAVEKLGFQILDHNGRQVPSNSIDWASLSASNFPYRIRQAPGPLNALGQIKFMFPNKHNVYLHDTPTRGLFAERQRAFSSGCIRVQDPVDLVTWLFKETSGWDKARFDAAIATGKEIRVNLQDPVPVHILYFTVVVDSSNTLRYLDDIYQRDQMVFQGLADSGT